VDVYAISHHVFLPDGANYVADEHGCGAQVSIVGKFTLFEAVHYHPEDGLFVLTCGIIEAATMPEDSGEVPSLTKLE
jgi:hypothetical protein